LATGANAPVPDPKERTTMKRLTILLATAALGLVLAVNASPANKNLRLAGARSSTYWTAERLAGPWYTPTELKALDAYAKASSK
jgi:hypothetical protein